MRLPQFDYLEPTTLREALDMISRKKGEVRILAGGTDLVPLLRKRLFEPAGLVSLRRLDGLRGIQATGRQIVIGALTTIGDLKAHPAVAGVFTGLVQAAAVLAAPPIRNIATVGGNILQNSRCHFYNQSVLFRKELGPCFKLGGRTCHAVKGGKRCYSVYQGDLAPMLIALGAKVKVQKKGGSRVVPVENIFTGNGRSPIGIGGDEVVTKIVLPLPGKSFGSSYQKFRIRGSVDYPLISAAAFVKGEGSQIVSAELVLGAAGSAPRKIGLTGLLTAQSPGPMVLEKISSLADSEVEMADNTILPAAYRRNLSSVMARRAVLGAINDMKKEG